MRSTMLLFKKTTKKTQLAFSAAEELRPAWPAAAGTSEFLNHLPQKRALKPFYYRKY
jgi:hypothetical protein